MSKINIGAWIVKLFVSATGTLVGANAVIATIINTALVIGASMAMSPRVKFGGSASTKRELQGRTLNTRGPINPRQSVYGEVKVGGQVVFIETSWKDTVNDNKYLHVVVAHASHEVKELGALYFGDEEIPLQAFVSEGVARLPPVSSKFHNFLKVYDHYGSPTQTYDSDLATESRSWNINHHLKGIAYTYLRLELNAENNVYPGGLPEISRVIKGKRVYDPRPISVTGATATNPVVVTAVAHGMETGDSAIHDSVGGMERLTK